METVRELHVNSCHVPNAYRTGFSRRINRLDNIRCLLQPASAVSKSQTSRRLLVAFRQPMARNFCRRSYLVHEKDKRRVKFRIESKNFTCADIPKSGQDSQDTKSAGMDTWDPWGLSMPQGLRAGAMFGLGTVRRYFKRIFNVKHDFLILCDRSVCFGSWVLDCIPFLCSASSNRNQRDCAPWLKRFEFSGCFKK